MDNQSYPSRAKAIEAEWTVRIIDMDTILESVIMTQEQKIELLKKKVREFLKKSSSS